MSVERYVELCKTHPQLALLIVPLFLWMTCSGIAQARLVENTADAVAVEFVVTKMYNTADGTLWQADFRLEGKISGSGELATIPVYRGEFDDTAIGDTLEIVATGAADEPYLLAQRAKKKRERIYFSLFGYPFNDVAVIGMGGVLGFLGWAIAGTILKVRKKS